MFRKITSVNCRTYISSAKATGRLLNLSALARAMRDFAPLAFLMIV